MGLLTEERLRELGWLKPGENIVSVVDNSQNYKMTGQVYSWTEHAIVDTGAGETERKYIFKCPHDTFGEEAITAWVVKRCAISQTLREAGYSVTNALPYDRGTIIEEYITGEDLYDLRGKIPKDSMEAYRTKIKEMAASIEKRLGVKITDIGETNFRVTSEGNLVWFDLDIEHSDAQFPPANAIEYIRSLLPKQEHK